MEEGKTFKCLIINGLAFQNVYLNKLFFWKFVYLNKRVFIEITIKYKHFIQKYLNEYILDEADED